MKRILISLIALIAYTLSFGQTANVKDVRQTYLWDVTLSMQGKAKDKAGNPSPNIWKQVKEALIADIQQISDDRTEIVVIPFQHKELDTWRAFATPDGKDQIIKRIQDYKIPLHDFNGKKTTKTYLEPPLKYVMDHIFTSDKVDVLKFMTDGADEANDGKYEKLLNKWCEEAKAKDAYGFYIVLTEEAQSGKYVLEELRPCRFDVVDVSEMNGSTVSFNTLAPPTDIAFNVRDDYGKQMKLQMSRSGNGPIPDGYKVKVTTWSNSYMEISEVVTLQSDYSVTVTPKMLMRQSEMIQQLPTSDNEKVFLKIEPAIGMDERPYSMTRILDITTECEMINKPEKTVKFHVR